MKNETIFGIIATVSVLVITGFVIWIVRKSNHKIQDGELKNEDVIGITQTWDSKSNEVIETLHPKIRNQARALINDLYSQGITYRFYSGRRTFEEQSVLYGKGRTQAELISANVDPKYAKPNEAKVTNAKPGSSYHNYALAIDGVEIKDGKALWNSPNEQKIVATAKKYGFFWGGDFVSFKDKPHFEIQSFGNISTLLSLYNANQIDANGFLIV